MSVSDMRIGDILKLERRAVVVEPGKTYREIGVRSFGRGLFEKEPTSGADLGSKRVFHVHPGDLVVSNIFAWEGAVAVAQERHEGMIGSHRFMTWIPDACGVDVEYLRHYFASDPGLGRLGSASPGSAGRNRTLSIKNFENIVIPLPDLDEQHRIATHLDALSQVSLRLDDTLMDRIGSLLDSVFDQFTWDTKLSELLQLDVDEFEVDPTAVYSQAGVFGRGRGMFLRGDLRGSETKYARLRRVAAGQVVLSRLKAFEGAVAMVPEGLRGSVLSQEFPAFSVRRGVEPGFVAGLVGRQLFTEAMQSRSTGVGARRERLSVDSFLKIQVPLPTQDVQANVAELVRDRQRLDAALSRRTRLKDALLPAGRNEIFSAMV